MSTHYHTPGPWWVGREGCVVADAPVKGRLMSPRDVEYYGGQLICESIGTKADALVLAAAPNLLVALEELLAALDDANFDITVVGNAPQLVRIADARRAAINAINKAEGFPL